MHYAISMKVLGQTQHVILHNTIDQICLDVTLFMSFWIFTHSKKSNKIRSTKQSKQSKKH